MSTVETVAMTLGYLFPVALIALLLTAQVRRHPRWLLTTVLLALPVFYVGHYLLLQQLQGWPSTAPLPEHFRLLGFDIREPRSKEQDGGRILLWIKAADDEQPRVHALAYRKTLHRELVAAGKRQEQGRPQLGTRSRGAANTVSDPGNRAPGDIRFSDAETRALPAKP